MVSNHCANGGRIFDRLPSLNYKVTSVTANGDRVFMEYIRTTDNEEMLVAEVLDGTTKSSPLAYIMGNISLFPFYFTKYQNPIRLKRIGFFLIKQKTRILKTVINRF
jgi:hypothetical protein